jgi:hypothetical protein
VDFAARPFAKLWFTQFASPALGFTLQQEYPALPPDIRMLQSPLQLSRRPRLWPISWVITRGGESPARCVRFLGRPRGTDQGDATLISRGTAMIAEPDAAPGVYGMRWERVTVELTAQ